MLTQSSQPVYPYRPRFNKLDGQLRVPLARAFPLKQYVRYVSVLHFNACHHDTLCDQATFNWHASSYSLTQEIWIDPISWTGRPDWSISIWFIFLRITLVRSEMAFSGTKNSLSKSFFGVCSCLYWSRDVQRGSGCLRVNAVQLEKMARMRVSTPQHDDFTIIEWNKYLKEVVHSHF